jgi:hypothetical protein
MGHMLATGTLDLLAFLANLNQNHWVAVVLDFRKDIFWYGDSLGGKIPSSMEESLKWWTTFHSGKNFTIKKLTITIQKDFFSCGLLAWNALCVFFFQETAHLIPAERVAEGRLKILVRILYQHRARDDVRNYFSVSIYLTMFQLPKNLEDEYAEDVNIADNLDEEGSLTGRHSDDDFEPDDDFELDDDFEPDDNFEPDEAMDIGPDFDETLGFGSADQPNITRSSSPDSPSTPTAVRMPPLSPTHASPTSTAETSNKIKATSAIHEGLSMIKTKNAPQGRGLFKYFKECSREQYLEDVARETEKVQASNDQQAYAIEKANQIKAANLRERGRERKRKSRMLKKKSEVQMGLRSPGGTKRRVCPPTWLSYSYTKINKGH